MSWEQKVHSELESPITENPGWEKGWGWGRRD